MRTLHEYQSLVETATSNGDYAALQNYADDMDSNSDLSFQAFAGRIRANIAFATAQYSEALMHYSRVADLYSELHDTLNVARAHNSIGNVYLRRGSYKEALEFYTKALSAHEQAHDMPGVARCLNNIGLVQGDTGEQGEALESFHRALDINESIQSQPSVALVLGNNGSVYNSIGSYPDAISHYHKALALYEELGLMDLAAGVLGNIGNVYNTTGTFDTAMSYYQRALRIHRETGDQGGVANVLSNLGNAHHAMGDHNTALDYLSQARALYAGQGDAGGEISTVGNMLHVALGSSNIQEAETLLASMLLMHTDEPAVVVQREIGCGAITAHHGQTVQAMELFANALDIALTHGLKKEIIDIHKRLRDVCHTANDLAGYVHHNTMYQSITDDINGKDTASRLAMQEKQREIDARAREHAKHMAVLHSTLPIHIADRVARGEVVNDSFDNAAVLFLDIVRFTTMSSQMEASAVVELLDRMFAICDRVMNTHGLMKIKTIGDSYMAVAFENINNAALAALDLIQTIQEVPVRIGIHCGPVVAGVLGKERMQYDVWGDTVNTASRMESSSLPGRIHISEAFAIELGIKGLVHKRWVD